MNRDAALYALGVGVCLSDAVDGVELKYVYHENGQGSIKVSFFFFFFCEREFLRVFSTLIKLGNCV